MYYLFRMKAECPGITNSKLPIVLALAFSALLPGLSPAEVTRLVPSPSTLGNWDRLWAVATQMQRLDSLRGRQLFISADAGLYSLDGFPFF